MEEKLKKIIKHYGTRNQLKKLVEEVFEFVEAVIDYENDWNSSDTTIGMIEQDKEHINEEYSDIKVVLEEFAVYLDIDKNKSKEIMQYKVDRQIGRIENEKGK